MLAISHVISTVESKCTRIRSDSAQYEPQVCAGDELTICGRVKAWLTVKDY